MSNGVLHVKKAIYSNLLSTEGSLEQQLLQESLMDRLLHETS